MNRTGGTRLFGRMMVLRITGDVARAGRAARNAGVGCWISELGMRVGVGILLSEGVARAGSGLRSSCAGFPGGMRCGARSRRVRNRERIPARFGGLRVVVWGGFRVQFPGGWRFAFGGCFS